MTKNDNAKTETFEKTLFKTADKLRENIDAAECLLTPQVQTLGRLRDALLPKLVQGQIRLKFR